MNRFLLLALGITGSFAFAEVSVQGPPEETAAYLLKNQSRVTLRGSASTVVEASIVKATISFSNDAATAGAAADSHQELRKQLMDRLQAIGIARGQMKVPKFVTLSPRYAGSGAATIGYTAASTITAEVADQSQYISLLGVVERTKGAQLGPLEYSHEKLTELHQAVLTNACMRVQTRKEAYEKNLGITLRLVSLTEEEGSERPEQTDSRFGQIPLKVAIHVVYEVVPADASGAPSPSGKPAAAPAKPAESAPR